MYGYQTQYFENLTKIVTNINKYQLKNHISLKINKNFIRVSDFSMVFDFPTTRILPSFHKDWYG